MLTVDNVSVFYGRVRALDRVSISVNQGEIVSIIAPTGRVSRPLWTVMGVNRPASGSLRWRGERLRSAPTGWRPGDLHGAGETEAL